ncbi:hypothetical protein QJS10_CPA10g00222 [Acorus calamus]|uniref:Uncharacterized protein n=1 Tax=Acorus calamus TaxID=4465 RepID=A0AAV9E0V8_ACOCL|nr:hypothetical protein QJS10_CPA10g00222 [Acorus calamus]
MSHENNQPFIYGVPLHGGVLVSGSSSASATKINMASSALAIISLLRGSGLDPVALQDQVRSINSISNQLITKMRLPKITKYIGKSISEEGVIAQIKQHSIPSKDIFSPKIIGRPEEIQKGP